MKYKDFKEGMVITHPPMVVEHEEMLAFSKRYDAQWFHTDAEKAEEGRWGGLIASGWFTGSLAMHMAVNAIMHDSNAFGSPGLKNINWHAPVRAGDTLRLEVHIDKLRTSASRADMGIVEWTWKVFNQDDVMVMDLVAVTFFDLTQE